tara:strand:+ start:2940 stop:3698 length:759 start_codon:yes stop_codon:yes gene_type:complete
MLPIYKSKLTVFNYDDIPAGHYFKVMLNGSKIQRYWHREKFNAVAKFIRPNTKLMDFGCGPGSFLHILKDKVELEKATGIDLASKQVDFAKENIAKDSDVINFVGLEEGENDLPFEDKSLDYITSVEVIEHIHPYIVSLIFKEFKRVLKDDGRMIITTPNYRSLWPFIEWLLNKLSPVKYHEQHINKFTPNSFVKYLETMGLEVVSFKSIFVISPFLAPISWKLAKFVQKLEEKLLPKFGSLLVAEVRKLKI